MNTCGSITSCLSKLRPLMMMKSSERHNLTADEKQPTYPQIEECGIQEGVDWGKLAPSWWRVWGPPWPHVSDWVQQRCLTNGQIQGRHPWRTTSFSTGIDYIEYDRGDWWSRRSSCSSVRFCPGYPSMWWPCSRHAWWQDISKSSRVDGAVVTVSLDYWTLTKAFGAPVFPISLLTQKRGRWELYRSQHQRASGSLTFQEPDNDERINIGLMKELTVVIRSRPEVSTKTLLNISHSSSWCSCVMTCPRCQATMTAPGGVSGSGSCPSSAMNPTLRTHTSSRPQSWREVWDVGGAVHVSATPVLQEILRERADLRAPVKEDGDTVLQEWQRQLLTLLHRDDPGETRVKHQPWEAYFKFKEWWTMSAAPGRHHPARSSRRIWRSSWKGDKKSTVFKGISGRRHRIADDSDSE